MVTLKGQGHILFPMTNYVCQNIKINFVPPFVRYCDFREFPLISLTVILKDQGHILFLMVDYTGVHVKIYSYDQLLARY